jgi:hypothetical protein
MKSSISQNEKFQIKIKNLERYVIAKNFLPDLNILTFKSRFLRNSHWTRKDSFFEIYKKYYDEKTKSI